MQTPQPAFTSRALRTMKIARPWSRVVAAGLSLLAGAGAWAGGTERSFHFDIANQTLSQALRAYGQISGQEIIFTEELVAAAKPTSLRGEFTADAALQRLLEGTGLIAERSPSGALMIYSQSTRFSSQSDHEGDRSVGSLVASGGTLRLAALQADGAAAAGAPAQSSDTAERTQAEAATDDGTEGMQLDEIVVTAQMRAQPLKDVPISITALGSDQLETLRVKSITDYILEIPNASFTSFGPFGTAVSLRGINAFSGGQFEPTAVLIDDAGFGATNVSSILSAQFLDLERVEVLRGPQGVLTGRNALGGAINLITAKPSTRGFEFDGTLDYGRFDTRFLKGVLNAPLGRTVAVRLVGYKEDSDGAVRNIGSSGGSSSTDNIGGRLAVRWQPNDALTLDVAYSYEDQEYGIPTYMRANIFRSPEDRQFFIDELASWGGDFYETDFFEDVGNNGGTVQKDVRESTTYKNRIASAGVRYEFAGHAVDLKYANYSYDWRNTFDWDQTNYAWLRSTWGATTDSDSAEVKFSSLYTGRFNWVAGVGYLKDVSGFPSIDEFGDWAYGANDGLPILNGDYNLTYVSDGRSVLKSLGVFANGFWDIGERWHVSAGGRYSVEKSRSGSFFLDGFDPEQAADPRFVEGARVTGADMQPGAKIRKFTPRIAVNYDLSQRITSYLQYATGYRAGYSNSPRAIEAGFPGEVDPETVENWELGLKGQLLGGRLSFASALFYMNYKDLQLTLVEGDPGSNPLDPILVEYDINAGRSVSQGIELEAAWALTDHLQISGGAAYTDAEIKSVLIQDPDTGERLTLRNQPVVGIRPWTGSLAATYERPITAGLEGNVRLSWQYQDSMYPEATFAVQEQVYFVPSFQTVHLSIGVSAGERWTLTAYADNLLNEKYFYSTQFEADTSRRGGMVSFTPRIWGLRFNVKLGR